MTDRTSQLEQAIRDAIEALATPAPRELIAEQLQRALEMDRTASSILGEDVRRG